MEIVSATVIQTAENLPPQIGDTYSLVRIGDAYHSNGFIFSKMEGNRLRMNLFRGDVILQINEG